MDTYTFEDVLTGSTVSCRYPGLQSTQVTRSQEPQACESLFFPGCSMLNYALPLVQAVYDLLKNAGSVQGISLLCCGKILSYEPDGEAVRARFEGQLREHVCAAGVRRIVTACPNCVTALRNCLQADEQTASIEVVPLPIELAALGYRIDEHVVSDMLAGYGTNTLLCPHDSCPDRKTGEFAQGMRDLLENTSLVEAKHHRGKSICCGSLVRATGNFAAADKSARLCASESKEAGGGAMVTACMSCAYQLTAAQQDLPVLHYLELLYNWRIPWASADQYMKLRFLFDDAQQEGEEASKRSFVPLA